MASQQEKLQKVYDLLNRLIHEKIKELAREEKACLEKEDQNVIIERYRFQSKYPAAFMRGQSEFNAATPLFHDRKPYIDEVIDKLRNCSSNREEIIALRSPSRVYTIEANYADEDDLNKRRIDEHILRPLEQNSKQGQILMQQITGQCIPNEFLFNPRFQSDYLNTPCFKGLHPSNPSIRQRGALDRVPESREMSEYPGAFSSGAAFAPGDVDAIGAWDQMEMGEGGKKSRSSKRPMSSKRSKQRKSRSRSRKSRSKSNKRKKQMK